MKQKRSLNSDSSVKKRKIIIGCAIAFATAIGITGVVVGAVALSRKPQVYNPYTPPVSVSTSVNGENVLHAALGLPGSNSYVAFDDLGQKATGGTWTKNGTDADRFILSNIGVLSWTSDSLNDLKTYNVTITYSVPGKTNNPLPISVICETTRSIYVAMDDQYLDFGDGVYQESIRAICTATYTASDSKPIWSVNYALGDQMNAGDGIARVAFSKITNVSSTCYVRYAYTAADAPTEYKDTNGNVPIKVTCTIDGVSDTKNLLFIAPNTNPNLSPDLITNQNYYFEVDSDGNLDTNFKMQTTPELAGLSSYIHAKDTADFSDLYPKDPKLLEYMRNEFDVRDIALLYINHAMSVAWDTRNYKIGLNILYIGKEVDAGNNLVGYNMDVIETGGVTSARNSWQNERLVTTTQVSGAYTEPLGTKPNSYITEMDDIIWDYTSTHDVNVNAPNIDMPTFDFDFGNMPRLNPDPYPPEKHLAFEAFNKDSPYDHVDDDVAGFGLAYDFDLNNLNKLNGWSDYGFGNQSFTTGFLFPNVAFPIENND